MNPIQRGDPHEGRITISVDGHAHAVVRHATVAANRRYATQGGPPRSPCSLSMTRTFPAAEGEASILTVENNRCAPNSLHQTPDSTPAHAVRTGPGNLTTGKSPQFVSPDRAVTSRLPRPLGS